MPDRDEQLDWEVEVMDSVRCARFPSFARLSNLTPYREFLFLAILALVFPTMAEAQRGQGAPASSIEVDPPQLTLEIGESATLIATVLDAGGDVLDVPVLFLSRSSRNLTVDQQGRVEAFEPGTFSISVRVPGGGRGRGFLTRDVEVVVPYPPLAEIEIRDLPEVIYTGTWVRPQYLLYDNRNTLRSDEMFFESGDAGVAGVDAYGQIMPRQAGVAVLRIRAGDLVEEVTLRVEPNPVRTLELSAAQVAARTGDVVRFVGIGRDESGRAIGDLPVVFSVDAQGPVSTASALIDRDGRFVAETPGRYTITAHAGPVLATATIEISGRDVGQEVDVLGRGPVLDYHTSDLWVWEGADGRDYAITGTWGGDGEAHLWDVTDPENIRRVDTVRVDARTVNDVKVSDNGQIAVITREGASDRRNGIVVLDVSNPRDVRELAAYDDGLTGGVHNAFIDGNYVYAVNNGTRYDVINVGEPRLPFRVARFELDTPGHSVHDVWVEDGIAYSSNWEDGVVLADVGNGIAGGAPDRPVEFASWNDERGDTHAAFPFRSQSTGRFYVIVGEESFPTGLDPAGPTVPAGYMHIVDFTDLENPVAVARFEVPEAGSHNIWIEDDVLYAAFYNAGLRVVDLSGELMGDLYRQGREIARFLPKDERGVVPNESMVWGAQPHKGTIFVSDWNSGLWAIRLEPRSERD